MLRLVTAREQIELLSPWHEAAVNLFERDKVRKKLKEKKPLEPQPPEDKKHKHFRDPAQEWYWPMVAKIGMEYHSPGADRSFQLKDHLPTDADWLERSGLGNPDYRGGPSPQSSSGKWYHTSPYSLKPGDRVIPHGAPSPGGDDWYGRSYHNRPKHVWLSGDLDEAQWWKHWAGHGSHIYEVHPGDRPQPWNFEGDQGWVAPHAVVKREVTVPERPTEWDEGI